MTRKVEVAIVGAGTAGLAALAVVRRHTESFVIVNDGAYGTTCARVGCMPSKALIEIGRALHSRRSVEQWGIASAAGEIDVPAALRRVRVLRDAFVAGVLKLTDDLGSRNVAGRARFVSPDMLDVAGARIQAGKIIIATGSRPIVPASWRALGDRIATTDDLFESIDLPRRIAVVGLGAVGAEMAQALARLGLEVTGFNRSARVGGLSDPDVSASAAAALGREIALHLGATVELAATGRHIVAKAGKAAVEVDRVLVALGRTPNLDNLGLEQLGLEVDTNGHPIVDPRTMQVSGFPIHLAGDCDGHDAILHEAADEGWIAGYNATSGQQCFARRTPVRITFTDPEIAVVGQRFVDIPSETAIVGEANLAGQGRSRMSGRDRGLIRVYAKRDSGQILGAELAAPDGEHLAHLLAVAIQQELTLVELLRSPFYHPTVEEALRTALRDAAEKLPGARSPSLAFCHTESDALD